MSPGTMKTIPVKADCSVRHQTIDGWGVNINSKYWDDGKLIPVMETLIDDLGATLFRLDACGKSNWIDPDNRLGPRALKAANLKRVYAGPDFRAAAGMGRYLNDKGIEPYLCLSGIVPRWMCASDGRTLKAYRAFSLMAASYAAWMRRAGVRFRLFGPLNETDLGPPEGPYVGPRDYGKAAEAMVDALNRHGLKDVRLVVPETAGMHLGYLRPILASRKLAGRIAVFGLHAYGNFNAAPLIDAVRRSPLGRARWWMTEYGDLDQTGEKEWFVAWVSYWRLMELLRQGFSAALNWDAFDNYHDHDESWSIYGLLRRGIRTWTPKKRFHSSRQMYRFVRPGFVRIECDSPKGITILAFAGFGGDRITLTGMNDSGRDVRLAVRIIGAPPVPRNRRFAIYRTSVTENCELAGRVRANPAAEITVPAGSIFTATTVE